MNSINLSIKRYILFVFLLTVLIFPILTLFVQYLTSSQIIEKSINKSINKISQNIVTRIQIVEDRVKNGIDLIDYYNEEYIEFSKEELHPSIEKIAILMRNNPFILASFYGYKNGDFLELINLNLNDIAKELYMKNENEKWLVVKIFNNHSKQIRFEEYLDKNFNLLRVEEISNSDYNTISRPWYIGALKSDDIIRTEPYTFENIKSEGITYSKKLNEDNTVFGVDISLKNLSSYFDDLVDFDNSLLFLLSKDSKSLIASNSFELNDSLAKIYEAIEDGKEIVNLEEQYYYITKKDIDTKIGIDQELILLTPKKEALDEFQEQISFGLMATLIFFIIILPFVLYLINILIKPISELIVENKKIIDRDYDNVKIVNTRIEELKALSKSLFLLSKNIKEQEENQNRFVDGFINMISKAIDEKSSYTGGHCHKVPLIMNLLVKAASSSDSEIFKEFKYISKDELRQIDVAAKLHDCGKITTPEYVMDKAVKLETLYNRIHEIRTRFEVIYRDLKINALENLIKKEDRKIVEESLHKELEKLQEEFAFIAECNIGSEYIKSEIKDRIKSIAKREWSRYFDDSLGLSNDEKSRYIKSNSNKEYLLSDKVSHIIKREFFDFNEFEKFGFKMDVPEYLYNFGEIYNLCIEKGTINEEERFKINEHIVTTIKMLESLPFPKNLSKVAEYAGNHHETLIGTGYPRKLTKNEMSLISRMIAVADVFEALSANDRPYKDTKKLSEVIQIMSYFVKDRHLDEDVFRLFIEKKIYLEYAENHLKKEQIDLERVDEVIKSLNI